MSSMIRMVCLSVFVGLSYFLFSCSSDSERSNKSSAVVSGSSVRAVRPHNDPALEARAYVRCDDMSIKWVSSFKESDEFHYLDKDIVASRWYAIPELKQIAGNGDYKNLLLYVFEWGHPMFSIQANEGEEYWDFDDYCGGSGYQDKFEKLWSDSGDLRNPLVEKDLSPTVLDDDFEICDFNGTAAKCKRQFSDGVMTVSRENGNDYSFKLGKSSSNTTANWEDENGVSWFSLSYAGSLVFRNSINQKVIILGGTRPQCVNEWQLGGICGGD